VVVSCRRIRQTSRAAQFGNHEVEDDEVGAQLARFFEGLHPVGGLAHLVSLARQIEAEGLPDHLLVLNHQDVLRSHDI
jgi:hypothetical protein